MSGGLKDDLFGLKDKLETLEKEFDSKLKDVDSKEAKFKELDAKVQEIIANKDSIVRLNIGGKEFQTKVSTLLSVKDTLFYKLICSSVEQSNEIEKEYFFDRSYTYFPLILDYLRTKKYTLAGLSLFEIEDLKHETDYYGISEISKVLEEMQKEVKFINMQASPQYSNAGNHQMESLNDTNLATGVCVQAPYEIKLELNYQHEIAGMEVGGWTGNSSLWYPGNGSNAKVSTSVDNTNWTEVGTVPSNLGGTIQTVNLRPSLCKWIRFNHTSYLGLGFLHLIKKK